MAGRKPDPMPYLASSRRFSIAKAMRRLGELDTAPIDSELMLALVEWRSREMDEVVWDTLDRAIESLKR